MQILMLAQFYWPDVGGEERHVQDLSEALVQRGHQVAVATIWHAGSAEFEVNNGVRIYRLRSTVQRASGLYTTVRQHAPPVPDPELVMGLKRVVDTERPQIVHAHNWISYSFLPLKRWSGAKLVATIHDHSLVCPRKTLMQAGSLCAGPSLGKCLACAPQQYGPVKGALTVLSHAALAQAIRHAVDRFFVVSSDVAERDHLIKFGLPHEVIPNFLPDAVADAGNSNFNTTPHDAAAQVRERLPAQPFILFAGDVRRFKGVLVLLDAYRQLTSPPALVLAGRCDLDIAPSAWESIPGVVALGRLPHDVLAQVQRRCLFGVQPSIGPETFGITILEAMAAGKAVIGSRLGGIPDVIANGDTGLLVPPGDSDALRRSMLHLLTNPDIRERMGQAGRRRADLFRASRMVARIEQSYMRLLGQRAHTAASAWEVP